MRKHGEGYPSGKYSGAQKATSSHSGDEVDAQATTYPPIDSEVSNLTVPRVSTRAKRIIKHPNRFLDSSEEDYSEGDNPNPSAPAKPPSDSEVASPPQPQVFTRAGRSTKLPIRFQDSDNLEAGISVLRCTVCVGTEDLGEETCWHRTPDKLA